MLKALNSLQRAVRCYVQPQVISNGPLNGGIGLYSPNHGVNKRKEEFLVFKEDISHYTDSHVQSQSTLLPPGLKVNYFQISTNEENKDDERNYEEANKDEKTAGNDKEAAKFFSDCSKRPCYSLMEAFGWGAAMLLGLYACPSHLKESHLQRPPVGFHLLSVSATQPDDAAATSPTLTITRATQTDQSTLDLLATLPTDYAKHQSDMGVRLIREGVDPRSGVRLLLEAAEMGEVSAMYNLGLCYHHGVGGEGRDEVKASDYYRLASHRGHVWATYNLAMLCMREKEGEGIELMRTAANQNLPEANLFLGLHYLHDGERMSDGVRYLKDVISSTTEANVSTSASARYSLAVCYDLGLGGLTSNPAKALQLYSEAARQGHVEATFNLAISHHHGLAGLPSNPGYAMSLYKRAADAGHVRAKHNFHLLSKRLGHLGQDTTGCDAMSSRDSSRQSALDRFLAALYKSVDSSELGEYDVEEKPKPRETYQAKPRFYIGDDLNDHTDISCQISRTSTSSSSSSLLADVRQPIDIYRHHHQETEGVAVL